MGSLEASNMFLREFIGEKATFLFFFLRILAILFVVPWMYGRVVSRGSSFSFLSSLLCFWAFLITSLICYYLYPLFNNTFLRYFISSSRWCLTEILMAQVTSVLIIWVFYARWCCDSTLRYLSLWVFFRYT